MSLTHIETHSALLSVVSSSTGPGLVLMPGLCDVVIGGPERKPDGESFFRISGLPVSRHCELVPERPGQASRQEGPAVAHVEPASDWVAVNTNPAADYHWHGEINSNK